MLEVVLAGALLVLVAWLLRRWWFYGDRGWMPLELRRATLAYTEHLLRAPGRPMTSGDNHFSSPTMRLQYRASRSTASAGVVEAGAIPMKARGCEATRFCGASCG